MLVLPLPVEMLGLAEGPGEGLGPGSPLALAEQPPGSSLCSIAQRTNGIALLAVFVATGVEELHRAENSIYFY